MLSDDRQALKHVEPRRILLIKPSALGDIVHALPVLTALRQRFPTAHIAWLVNAGYAPLLQGHPHLDEVIPFDRQALRKGLFRGPWAFLGLLRELRRGAFDLVIDLQGLLRSGILARASCAPRRLGLRSAREGARWAYTDIVDDAQLHAVDRYWRVIEDLGAGESPKQFVLPRSQADESWAERLLNPLPRPWLAMNVGTRWETKRWPVEHFLELARQARNRFGGTILLVGSAEEAILGRQVAAALPDATVDLLGKTSLPALVSVLARVDVMVSNDSGPLHLAAALGRPVVAPFTCTSPLRTGPYDQLHRAVLTDVWCAASYLKSCRRMDCMRELTPDRLWPVLESVLTTWQRRSA